MPTMFCGYRRRPRTCNRRYSWSTSRGGCRFTPGHKGDCKPAKSGRRDW